MVCPAGLLTVEAVLGRRLAAEKTDVLLGRDGDDSASTSPIARLK